MSSWKQKSSKNWLHARIKKISLLGIVVNTRKEEDWKTKAFIEEFHRKGDLRIDLHEEQTWRRSSPHFCPHLFLSCCVWNRCSRRTITSSYWPIRNLFLPSTVPNKILTHSKEVFVMSSKYTTNPGFCICYHGIKPVVFNIVANQYLVPWSWSAKVGNVQSLGI